jgi:type IV secretory pathway VirD2 relaxase
MAKDEEWRFRLRPRKPAARRERATWASAYKIIMHHARATSSRLGRSAGRISGANRTGPYSQRCAVRVTYSKNGTSGQWRAHGRYVARESATHDGRAEAPGFDRNAESIDIAKRLESWQKASDERLWKVIVSPEFGDRADLKRLTRELLARMEGDLRTPLQWVAVAHYNTEHPHVHVALRGIDAEGHALRLSRDYIRQGIRSAAEDLCTRQLGYRTEFDAATAQRREVHEHRYTSLDRVIKRDTVWPESVASTFFTVVRDPNQNRGNPTTRLMRQHTTERLIALEGMGLAERADQNLWRVRGNFEDVLRAMQRSADRQKMLAAHGVPMSDERLPLVVFDLRSLTTLDGRILVHGEEETGRKAGRSYLMLEGTDGRVHYVYYTPEIEAARNRGGLRANSFIRLRKFFSEGRPLLEIDELGDSEAILRDKRYLRETVQRLIRRGIVPLEDGWNGWLGRYQKTLSAESIAQNRVTTEAERDRNQDRGR